MTDSPDTEKSRRRAAAGLSLVEPEPTDDTPDAGPEDQADDAPVVVTTESVVTPGSEEAAPEPPPTLAERIAADCYSMAALVKELSTGQGRVSEGTAVQIINTNINYSLAIHQIRQQAQGFGSIPTAQEEPTDGQTDA